MKISELWEGATKGYPSLAVQHTFHPCLRGKDEHDLEVPTKSKRAKKLILD